MRYYYSSDGGCHGLWTPGGRDYSFRYFCVEYVNPRQLGTIANPGHRQQLYDEEGTLVLWISSDVVEFVG